MTYPVVLTKASASAKPSWAVPTGGGGGGGTSAIVVDNGDGTFTLTASSASLTDNGNGTFTLTG